MRFSLDDNALEGLALIQRAVGASTASEAARYAFRRMAELLNLVGDEQALVRACFPDGRADLALDFPRPARAQDCTTKPPIVLGFGCKQHRGKDSAARYAVDWLSRLQMPSRLDSFASSLKQGIAQGVFGLSAEQLYDPEAKLAVDPFWDMSPRRIMQLAGTEAMQVTFGRDIWCKTLLRRAAASPEVSILVTDVRFPHEVDAVRRLGGAVIRIDRDIKPENGYEEHVSETALDGFDDWDHTIDNNGTLAQLKKQVRLVVDAECERQAQSAV